MRVGAVLVAVAILGVTAGVAAQSAGKKFQCWTDEKGQRACGDRVPPQYAQKERQVFDGEGRVVEIKQRPKTAEELAEIKRQKKEEADRQRAEQERVEYDRFLMSTFNSTRDLERMRDQRIATIDGRLGLIEKSLTDNEKALQQLRDQAANAEKHEKKVPERVTRQIKEFEGSLAGNRKAAAQLRSERAAIETKFSADIERFKVLRATTGLPPS